MNERKFNRVLETGMAIVMSFTLNSTAMYLLGAPMALINILIGWAGAFAVAVAINYLFPVMNWIVPITKNIKNKTVEYIVRILIFAFIMILFNSVWCLVDLGLIAQWPNVFLPLWGAGTVAIFIALPIVVRIAGAMAKESNGTVAG
jgi:putative flippase GtrA